MKLYLVRHGDASGKQENGQRPLSAKGQKDIKKIAGYLQQNKNIHLDLIMHSRKLRAKQTAEIIAEHLKPTNWIIETDGLNPEDFPSVWGDQIIVSEKNIMLVGHLPYMPNLVSYLMYGKKIVSFETGTVVCLEYNDGKWKFLWKVNPSSI